MKDAEKITVGKGAFSFEKREVDGLSLYNSPIGGAFVDTTPPAGSADWSAQSTHQLASQVALCVDILRKELENPGTKVCFQCAEGKDRSAHMAMMYSLVRDVHLGNIKELTPKVLAEHANLCRSRVGFSSEGSHLPKILLGIEDSAERSRFLETLNGSSYKAKLNDEAVGRGFYTAKLHTAKLHTKEGVVKGEDPNPAFKEGTDFLAANISTQLNEAGLGVEQSAEAEATAEAEAEATAGPRFRPQPLTPAEKAAAGSRSTRKGQTVADVQEERGNFREAVRQATAEAQAQAQGQADAEADATAEAQDKGGFIAPRTRRPKLSSSETDRLAGVTDAQRKVEEAKAASREAQNRLNSAQPGSTSVGGGNRSTDDILRPLQSAAEEAAARLLAAQEQLEEEQRNQKSDQEQAGDGNIVEAWRNFVGARAGYHQAMQVLGDKAGSDEALDQATVVADRKQEMKSTKEILGRLIGQYKPDGVEDSWRHFVAASNKRQTAWDDYIDTLKDVPAGETGTSPDEKDEAKAAFDAATNKETAAFFQLNLAMDERYRPAEQSDAESDSDNDAAPSLAETQAADERAELDAAVEEANESLREAEAARDKCQGDVNEARGPLIAVKRAKALEENENDGAVSEETKRDFREKEEKLVATRDDLRQADTAVDQAQRVVRDAYIASAEAYANQADRDNTQVQTYVRNHATGENSEGIEDLGERAVAATAAAIEAAGSASDARDQPDTAKARKVAKGAAARAEKSAKIVADSLRDMQGLVAEQQAADALDGDPEQEEESQEEESPSPAAPSEETAAEPVRSIPQAHLDAAAWSEIRKTFDEFKKDPEYRRAADKLTTGRAGESVHEVCQAAVAAAGKGRTEPLSQGQRDHVYVERLRDILANPVARADFANDPGIIGQETLKGWLENSSNERTKVKGESARKEQVGKLLSKHFPDMLRREYLAIGNKKEFMQVTDLLDSRDMSPSDLQYEDGADKKMLNLHAFARSYRFDEGTNGFVKRTDEEKAGLSGADVADEASNILNALNDKKANKEDKIKNDMISKAKQLGGEDAGFTLEDHAFRQACKARQEEEKKSKEELDKQIGQLNRSYNQKADQINAPRINMMAAASSIVGQRDAIGEWLNDLLQWLEGMGKMMKKARAVAREGHAVFGLAKVRDKLHGNNNYSKLSAIDRKHLKKIQGCILQKGQNSSDSDLLGFRGSQPYKELENFHRENINPKIKSRKNLWKVGGESYDCAPHRQIKKKMMQGLGKVIDKVIGASERKRRIQSASGQLRRACTYMKEHPDKTFGTEAQMARVKELISTPESKVSDLVKELRAIIKGDPQETDNKMLGTLLTNLNTRCKMVSDMKADATVADISKGMNPEVLQVAPSRSSNVNVEGLSSTPRPGSSSPGV
jgi:hypothetical protein